MYTYFDDLPELFDFVAMFFEPSLCEFVLPDQRQESTFQSNGGKRLPHRTKRAPPVNARFGVLSGRARLLPSHRILASFGKKTFFAVAPLPALETRPVLQAHDRSNISSDNHIS
jgi:hypothetical protein